MPATSCAILYTFIFYLLLFFFTVSVKYYDLRLRTNKKCPRISWNTYASEGLVKLFNGAGDENRTRTGCPTRPSNVRVYHFHHPGTRDLEIIRSISSFVKSLFEKTDFTRVLLLCSIRKLIRPPCEIIHKKIGDAIERLRKMNHELICCIRGVP